MCLQAGGLGGGRGGRRNLVAAIVSAIAAAQTSSYLITCAQNTCWQPQGSDAGLGCAEETQQQNVWDSLIRRRRLGLVILDCSRTDSDVSGDQLEVHRVSYGRF